MNILESIQQLLKFKKSATINEIAQIAEVKRSVVLAELNLNEDYIVKSDKKPGQIIGLRDLRNEATRRAYEKGLVYKIELENYDSCKVINTKSKKVDHLRKTSYYGAFMDSYRVSIIEYNEDNLNKVREAGLVGWKDFYDSLPKLSELWKRIS